jgi:hypothetical protein
MSRHITLAAFLVTLAVVVPAAWHAPDADIPTDGPQLRPKQGKLHIGGATISVDLDRGVLMSGGRLKVALVGTADTTRKIALDVRAMQDNGMGAERVENPPTEISRRRIIIEAAPGGGKPTELAFDLKPWGMKAGRMQWYDIDVTPAGKRGEDVSYYDEEDAPATAAKVGAAVWGGNNLALTLEAPASIPAGAESFSVKLHVKNTAKKPIRYVDIKLGGPSLNYGAMEGLGFYDEDNYDIEQVEQPEPAEQTAQATAAADDDDDDGSIAPGAERVYEYKVTPKQPAAAKLGLLVQANATVVVDEAKDKYLYLGAMDAITINRAPGEAPAPVTAGLAAPTAHAAASK